MPRATRLDRVVAVDGDGAGDLLSQFDSDYPKAPPETDGWLQNRADFHVHYGKPTARLAPLR